MTRGSKVGLRVPGVGGRSPLPPTLPQTRSAPGRGRGLIGANAYKKGALQK